MKGDVTKEGQPSHGSRLEAVETFREEMEALGVSVYDLVVR